MPRQYGDEPPYPAPDPSAVARFEKWKGAQALPAVFLEPRGTAPQTPGGTRVGGAVWLAAGESWPKDAKGRPMTFLAQVDFSEIPRLPDYPEAGVLQFFIGRDMNFGADFDHPEKGTFRVIWREDFAEKGSLQFGRLYGKNGMDIYSPIEGNTAAKGVKLVGRPGMHEPSIDSWLFQRDLKDITSGKGRGTVNALVQARFTDRPERHHIGGHPEFTQDDWRAEQRYHDVNRVLLNLWSDRHVMWGDAGQGQFLIRRKDLLRKDFSRVFYQWDSG